MDWIKVSPETMPDTEVIAISMTKGPCYKEYLIGWVGKDKRSETGFICESEGERLYDVTHWMPKPDPPAED